MHPDKNIFTKVIQLAQLNPAPKKYAVHEYSSIVGIYRDPNRQNNNRHMGIRLRDFHHAYVNVNPLSVEEV